MCLLLELWLVVVVCAQLSVLRSYRYKVKQKELLQTLKPDDIECPQVIVTAVMNGELPVDSDVEMEVFPKAKPENTHLQRSAISSSRLPEKRMATQLDNDKIIHDSLMLKNGLLAIEKEVATIKPFWKLQTTLPPPVKVTYTIPTKKGTLGAVKTCGRCKKQKDGYGEKNTNNHMCDIYDDNFLHWSKDPYPLPKTNLRHVPLCKNMLGKWSINECDIKDRKIPQSVEMINMRVFMAMTWVEEKMDWVLAKERLHIEAGKRK
ncbi:hypothetical protein BT69DRAFT_1368109 [Atractiella rhizophila]|nr:hypothetical protein BT69DRAFT_1368109 [Atractiella rhizophila]